MPGKIITERKMSFLPEDYVERRLERRTSLICLAMFVVMLAGVGSVYAFKASQLGDSRDRLRKMNTDYVSAAKKIAQIEVLEKQRDEMRRKAQVTATLLERIPRTNLLADLINRRPEGLSWLELNLITKVVQPPRQPVSRSAMANAKDKKKEADRAKAKEPEPLPLDTVTLTIVGVAPTDVQVANYLGKLKVSPFQFDASGSGTANITYTEETKLGDTPMRKFRIEMTLSSTADVRTLGSAVGKPEHPRDPIESSSDSLSKVTGPGEKAGGNSGPATTTTPKRVKSSPESRSKPKPGSR